MTLTAPVPRQTRQARAGAPRRARPPRSGGARGRRGRGGRGRPLTRQVTATSGLVGLALLAGFGMVMSPEWVSSAAMLFLVLLGVFVLRLAGMVALSVVVLGQMVTLELTGLTSVTPGTLAIEVLGVVCGVLFVRSRDRLGLQGATSDLMLVDLRDRLVAHGRIPLLPEGWRVDSIVRSAYAEAFSGDFVVASRTQGGRLLEIVLVDVSGKGQEAGVRSLLLSGAFGGLLGAMPREGFLPAANTYLLEQNWPEGFATAVHLAIDLDSGLFWVSTAGHPPAVHLHAGSGRIDIIDTTGGPVLGIVTAPTFVVHAGRMERGDTLMFYTDGLVESPGADVDLGIDRLMGEAERVIATRSGGADAVVAGVRAGDADDRALILVHRD
ncbi:PP2C family protein-serine/threonine phosphatase [Cellulomonas sp. KRMCY2]|uniref:PP2C family protein-serine/threonine phosphatase n=1 Tax=Cellulomonas sp. KRMCY2 TaxID=1304865 RepID=UPI0012DE0D33|nr:PP2C family protein-serine/threonine phosphatase [Cellulomonas sp. KRMCY2]